MPLHKQHSIQTIELKDYPNYLDHEFEEGDVVVIRTEGGHKQRLLKDIIRETRKIWRRINAEKGLFKKHRFSKETRQAIWREYKLISSSEGVVIGRSPVFGLPIHSISNVCYLVGGSGFGGLSYEYDVCFVEIEIDIERNRENKVCRIWTFWRRAIKKVEEE